MIFCRMSDVRWFLSINNHIRHIRKYKICAMTTRYNRAVAVLIFWFWLSTIGLLPYAIYTAPLVLIFWFQLSIIGLLPYAIYIAPLVLIFWFQLLIIGLLPYTIYTAPLVLIFWFRLSIIGLHPMLFISHLWCYFCQV